MQVAAVLLLPFLFDDVAAFGTLDNRSVPINCDLARTRALKKSGVHVMKGRF